MQKEAGVTPRFQEGNGQGSLVAFIVSLNFQRRHLDESQRARVAAKLDTLADGQPQGGHLAEGRCKEQPQNS